MRRFRNLLLSYYPIFPRWAKSFKNSIFFLILMVYIIMRLLKGPGGFLWDKVEDPQRAIDLKDPKDHVSSFFDAPWPMMQV